MVTVKYIIFILFYLNPIVHGHNALRLKTSLGKLKNVNLETLLELHKDMKAGRVMRNGSLKEPPQKNTAISKLVFLVDVINEILNDGLSDKENEVLSNVIAIHGDQLKNKMYHKNVTLDILNHVFNKDSNTLDTPSDDVNQGIESLEQKLNRYLISSETNHELSPQNSNTYVLSREIYEDKEVSPKDLNLDFKPMENKWHKLLNESLRIMESDNTKDLKTVKPVIESLLNKNLMSSKFKLRETLNHESVNKEKSGNKGLDKGYPKVKNKINSTGKSVNIKLFNINDVSDDDDNVDIEMFDDLNANESSAAVGSANYRRRLKISAMEIKDYRKNADGVKKLKKQMRRRDKKERGRRNLDDEDPNYNEDDYYWQPTPLLTRRIYQGIPVRITDFPFMASIHMFQTLQCAGSIIKSDLVLTAASCLQIAWNNRFFRENPRFLEVRVGSTRFYGGGEVIEVAEVYFHPHYKPKTLTSNLAIIRLYRNLRFSNTTTRYVVKIKYDREDHKIPDNNAPVTLIGFGAVRPSNRLHYKGFGKLQYAILPIYPYSDCKDIYTKEYVTKFNFCAGLMAQGSGACNHDVGDPGISDGVILGVVSFGSPVCGRVDTPTVFTKIGQFKEWIDEIYMIEPVIYQHRYSTTPVAVPLEPIPLRTDKPTSKHSGRNKQVALAKGHGPQAKLSNDGRGWSQKPFKVRPMTKTVDVLEYFPADDPLKMGNTKKRKLRMGQKRIVQQTTEPPKTVPNHQLTGGFKSPQLGLPNIPFGMHKLPFGMEQPQILVPQSPPFGMQQPAFAGNQQLTAGGNQQQYGAGNQQQYGTGNQQQYGIGNQYGAENQQQAGGGMTQQLQGGGQFGQPSGGLHQLSPQLSTTGLPAIARMPALSLDVTQTEGTTTESAHEFIPADCNESDIEGTGIHALQCSVSAAAAAMPMTVTRSGDITSMVDIEVQMLENVTDKARDDPKVIGPKLTNANSEAIDDENKVSSLIETIFEPAMQADIRQGVTDSDNQQDGAQKLKDIDKSIMSMLYVTDREDNNNKEDRTYPERNENVNNDSGFKDYNVPRGEGLAVPDDVEIIEIDEPNEFRFRAADDSNKNKNSNDLLKKAMSGEDIDPVDISGLFGRKEVQELGATMEDVVTNVPRYRDDTDPPEGYYEDRNP